MFISANVIVKNKKGVVKYTTPFKKKKITSQG